MKMSQQCKEKNEIKVFEVSINRKIVKVKEKIIFVLNEKNLPK